MSLPALFAYMAPEQVAALCKLAGVGSEESPALHVARPLAAGAAGLGVGTLAGIGAGHLANQAYKRFSGKNIAAPHLMAAVPVIGAGLGLAYSMAQAHQAEAVRHALENPDHKP